MSLKRNPHQNPFPEITEYAFRIIFLHGTCFLEFFERTNHVFVCFRFDFECVEAHYFIPHVNISVQMHESYLNSIIYLAGVLH